MNWINTLQMREENIVYKIEKVFEVEENICHILKINVNTCMIIILAESGRKES